MIVGHGAASITNSGSITLTRKITELNSETNFLKSGGTANRNGIPGASSQTYYGVVNKLSNMTRWVEEGCEPGKSRQGKDQGY